MVDVLMADLVDKEVLEASVGGPMVDVLMVGVRMAADLVDKEVSVVVVPRQQIAVTGARHLKARTTAARTMPSNLLTL